MASINTSATPRANQHKWVPVLCGIAVICMESTNKMGSAKTDAWLRHLVSMYGYSNSGGAVDLLNHYLRKGGHFAGYGLLGLFFSSAWFTVLRPRVAASWSSLRMRAGAYGIASAFVVASADEIHQIFLPSRSASALDVLLDTSGALTLNLIFFGFLALRRHALLSPGPITTLGLSMAGLPQRMSNSRPMRGLTSRSSRSATVVRRTMRKAELIRFHTR